ncbi:transposase [Micromonospora sp. ATCC 39149]|uniref:DDE-type integrase/transposase/recombinase n=1 Tax=Micromonospora carbonacea TaxID=47853 RepID=A0A7D5YFC7_9ACTN|nr:Mu transposase C-terminal domain-containing protein [Micromonospora sp. ATCC 39149]EEP69782.1 transposase [Micromonospora sp. ATCC 39149]QLJ96254.1 DDE-type integrase/transposase/recombinase [Micromonospora carbonacea]
MPRPSAQQWDAALHQLAELRTAGQLTGQHVATVAVGLGVTERSVWRRLAQPAEQFRRGFQLSQTDRDALADYRGNVAAVFRARQAALRGDTTAAGLPIHPQLLAGWAGAPPVTRRTLERAFAAEVTPAQREAVRHGERARRAKLVYLRRRGSHRNQVWEGDHKNLPILVLPPRGPACRPWLTMFLDDATRVITGWAIATTPHAGTVLTALRMGMLPDAASPAHGLPGMLRLDQGLEFASDAVTTAMGTLAVEVLRLPPFQPHKKGKVERSVRTVDQMLLSALPGFTEGPREASGRLTGPLDDRVKARHAYADAAAADTAAVVPLRWEVLVKLFADWVRWYNFEHRHSQLGGRAPAQAWAEDPTPLRHAPEQHLVHLLLADEARTVGGNGIRFRNLHYADPSGKLRERRGTAVRIRYMPHDESFLHVYLDGQYLTTCHPDTMLTDAQQAQYDQAVREQARQAAADKRSATRRARQRLRVLSDADQTTTTASSGAVSLADREAAARARRRPATPTSTSLLGLVPPAPLEDEPVDLDDPARWWTS